MQDKDVPAPSRAPSWQKLALAAGAACAAICGPFVVQRESGGQQHLSAYHGAADPSGVWTICDGDTLGVKPGDRETPAGCAIRVDARLASFVQPVLKAAPGLYGHPYQLAASISLAYNIGAANFANSTVARRFRAGDWAGAFLVRVPLIKPKGRLLQEASFTLLGMLGAFVTIIDQHAGPGPAFWWGIGFGAVSSSLAEIGKSAMWGGVQDRLQAAGKALLGLNGGKG